MKALRIFLFVVLVDFLALTAYAAYQHGIVGFLEWTMKSPATILISVDLIIALTLVCTWLVRDARQRGVSATPYLLLTLFTGSAGPLLYLLRRPQAAAARG